MLKGNNKHEHYSPKHQENIRAIAAKLIHPGMLNVSINCKGINTITLTANNPTHTNSEIKMIGGMATGEI